MKEVICSIYYLLVMVHLMAQSVQPADLLGSEALGLKESSTKDIEQNNALTDCSLRTGLT